MFRWILALHFYFFLALASANAGALSIQNPTETDSATNSTVSYDLVVVQQKDAFFQGTCEGLARIQIPGEINTQDDTQIPYVVEHVTIKGRSTDTITLSVDLTISDSSDVVRSEDYFCFRCMNRTYNQVVLSLQNNHDEACKQESL